MLADGMVAPDRQPAYIMTLQREAARLSHLVDNVLTYARLERGRAREALSAVPLGELLDRAHDQLRTQAERADLALQIDVTDALRQTLIHVDAAAVDRILVNLVDNACKYAADATDRRLLLSAAAAAGGVAITVRDFGPGLPAGASNAFRPFKKLRDADQQKPGIGLGLALCHRLANRMHGSLSHSPATPGAAFTLWVPAAE
jgi:signal transduction histidine kinase